jgi:hypothetical protein
MPESDVLELEQRSVGFTGRVGDVIVGCAGVIRHNQYKGFGWAIIQQTSPLFFAYGHKTLVEILNHHQPFRYVEVHVDPRNANAMRWIKMLGFYMVRPFVPYHFHDGAPATEWAWERD